MENKYRKINLVRLTVGVTRWWAGRDNANLTEPASNHANCLKTRLRSVPPHLHCTERSAAQVWPLRSLQGIGCTLCWAFCIAQGSLPEKNMIEFVFMK
jgi:hypothetical protein